MTPAPFFSISSSVATRLAVPAFIFVWATGYIVAKLAAQDAEPLSFLIVRYAGVCVLMAVLAVVGRAVWPKGRDVLHIAFAGVLIQALYLGGVWVAIRMGLSAGVAALIVNMQPVLTACLAHWTGDRVTRRQMVGVIVGFAGVLLVLAAKLGSAAMSGALAAPTVICFAALLGTTLGVIYQKRFVPSFDLRTGQVIQFASAIVATLPFALAFEHFAIVWSNGVIFAMLWSIFVLSGVGISIMFYLLRTGSVTRLTSTMYIVPGLTALMAWAIFGDVLGWNVVAGMVVTVVGIYLVVSQPAAK